MFKTYIIVFQTSYIRSDGFFYTATLALFRVIIEEEEIDHLAQFSTSWS